MLYVSDPLALQHILKEPKNFPKPLYDLFHQASIDRLTFVFLYRYVDMYVSNISLTTLRHNHWESID